MNKLTSRAFLSSLLITAAANAVALPTGMTNITINDGDYSNSNVWYSNNHEDQEVEPGMAINQVWDLEGVYTYGSNQLAMVGGFDFRNGVAGYRGQVINSGHRGPVQRELDFRSGDIFIDVGNDHIAGGANARDGNGQTVVTNTFGYDYVLDVDWQQNSYRVYSLNNNSRTQVAYYDANYGSSPWQYVSGGTEIGQGTFTYENRLSNADTGFLGDIRSNPSHYAAYGFDLSFLGNSDFFTHFTMGCGNDNLMGFGHVSIPQTNVPEPSSLALFALGLIGLGRARNRARG